MASLVEKYEAALAADPRSRVFADLARALIERGDHDRALGVLRSGLTHHPDSVQARVLLGRALLSLRRPSEAISVLQEALEKTPEDARIQILLDQARASVAKGPATEAESTPDPSSPKSARAATPIPMAIDQLLQEVAAGEGTDSSLETTGSIPLDKPLPPRRAAPPPPPPPIPAPPPTAQVLPPTRREVPPPPPSPRKGAGSTDEQSPQRPRKGAGSADDQSPSQVLDVAEAGVAPAPAPAASGEKPADESPLKHLPDKRAPTATGLPETPTEAFRIAAKYEHKLRDELSAEEEEKPEGRHLPVTALVVVALLLAASAGTYFLVRRSMRAGEARGAVAAARAGLARDTLGSIREAARALEAARAFDPELPDSASLAAQATSLLWSDFADSKALERARVLEAAPGAGEGALVARFLTAGNPAERDPAADALVRAAPSGGSLLRTLAAGVLRQRGDREGARSHLEAAARASPPSLRALADLGDLLRTGGDPDEALRYYLLALEAHPTHPRSVLGAAEARLAVGRGLEDSARELAAMDKDEASKPPVAEALRAELVHARVLFALGRGDDAVRDLTATGSRFPGRVEVPATVAELEMARGAFDRGEVAAERAARIAPGDPAMKELVARARLGRGRLRDLLRETEDTPSRPLRLIRAQARCEMGEWDRARAELEATRRDGRMTAEAAAWMALCEASTGRLAQASSLVQALDPSRTRIPVVLLAQGRLLLAQGKPAEAEKALRASIAMDGAPVLARVYLARVLRERKLNADALEVINVALQKNPFHAGARLERAQIRLDIGDGRAAADDARRVLEDRPGDPDATRILGAAERRR